MHDFYVATMKMMSRRLDVELLALCGNNAMYIIIILGICTNIIYALHVCSYCLLRTNKKNNNCWPHLHVH